MSWDVIVVGGGAAGAVASAVLAGEGKRVLLLERDQVLAGRARYFDVDDYRLQWGPHLLEDPGSGITAILKRYGYDLEHGPTNDGLAVWSEGKWQAAGEFYESGRRELARVATEIAELDLDTLDALDQRCLRDWLVERTDHEQVIALFELMAVLEGQTGRAQDHSASDNLFMRSLHLRERRKPGYSYVPVGGFEQLFEGIGSLASSAGAEVRRGVSVAAVAAEAGRVRGVYVEVGERRVPNEVLPIERLDAEAVILTLPAWDVLALLPEDQIPAWYLDLIRRLTTEDARGSWIGFYAALPEPAQVFTSRELAVWFATPRTGLPGFGFTHSMLDPGSAPDGGHLFICGVACDLAAVRDRRKLASMFDSFEADMEELYPVLGSSHFRVRHLITNFGTKARPGLVGAMRPHNIVPGVEGLFAGGDMFRGRSVGIDRAARSGLTCAELVLGRRVSGLEGTWRY
ncbi:MAG TPA: FAD-dependent oxidoreductase [Acidimicrobiales bacterium]|nr:FAD-dependent oxidoreductase [Acidimicrobiales bacterium]